MKFPFASTILLVLAATVPWTTHAFSGGAGGCPSGVAAVGGSHLGNPSIVTGTLVQGGLAASIDNTPFPLTSPLQVGVPHDVTVSGTDFRGILIMCSDPNCDLTEQDPTVLGPSIACSNQGFVGITHINPTFKSTVSGTFECATAGVYEIGVTVVLSNNNNEGSVFYYTPFSVTCADDVTETVAPTDVATDPATVAATATALPTSTFPPTNGTAVPSLTEVPTEMFTQTENPTENVTATDIPTEFNETEAPTEAMMGETNETMVPDETLPPAMAPVAAIENPPSSATTTSTTLLLLALSVVTTTVLTMYQWCC